MRFLKAVALLTLLIVVPAQAALPVASQNSPVGANGVGHSFGKAFCDESVPCPESSNASTPTEYAQGGSACVHERLGYDSITEFFDEGNGLDSSGCLTTKPNALGAPTDTNSLQLSPQCCVIHKTTDVCIYRCMLLTK